MYCGSRIPWQNYVVYQYYINRITASREMLVWITFHLIPPQICTRNTTVINALEPGLLWVLTNWWPISYTVPLLLKFIWATCPQFHTFDQIKYTQLTLHHSRANIFHNWSSFLPRVFISANSLVVPDTLIDVLLNLNTCQNRWSRRTGFIITRPPSFESFLETFPSLVLLSPHWISILPDQNKKFD